MRRVAFAAVVAMLGLALAAPARSAPVTFDLSGVVGSWFRSTDQNASNPAFNGGECTPGMSSPPAPGGAGNDCFRYPFSAGSSISIDITGDRVELLGGTLITDAVTSLVFDTIVLTHHWETTILPGLVGTLYGDSILWTSPENGWMNVAFVTVAGTLSCNGPNCGLISMPEGQVFPLESQWPVLSNTSLMPCLYLGYWVLNPQHDEILASTLAANVMSNVAELGNRRSGGFTFGPTGLGIPVYEPKLIVLMVVGIGGLALRPRRSGSATA